MILLFFFYFSFFEKEEREERRGEKRRENGRTREKEKKRVKNKPFYELEGNYQDSKLLNFQNPPKSVTIYRKRLTKNYLFICYYLFVSFIILLFFIIIYYSLLFFIILSYSFLFLSSFFFFLIKIKNTQCHSNQDEREFQFEYFQQEFVQKLSQYFSQPNNLLPLDVLFRML